MVLQMQVLEAQVGHKDRQPRKDQRLGQGLVAEGVAMQHLMRQRRILADGQRRRRHGKHGRHGPQPGGGHRPKRVGCRKDDQRRPFDGAGVGVHDRTRVKHAPRV